MIKIDKMTHTRVRYLQREHYKLIRNGIQKRRLEKAVRVLSVVWKWGMLIGMTVVGLMVVHVAFMAFNWAVMG